MKTLSKTEIAAMNGRTVFLHKVKDVSDGLAPTERVVKESSNGKIGNVVTVGPWAGAKIYTVTLEERATCPSTCLHWLTCYGKNMRNAIRYVANDAMIRQMEKDLAHWQAVTDKTNARRAKKGLAPAPFVVRLHVLGDFFSVAYVEQWAQWLDMFPSLRVWGYSHWHPGTAIGDALLTLRETTGGSDSREGARFCLRFSDDSEHGPGEISDINPIAAQLAESGQAFVCPEQTQSEERANGPNAINCGNCGLCWNVRKRAKKKHVIFLKH